MCVRTKIFGNKQKKNDSYCSSSKLLDTRLRLQNIK